MLYAERHRAILRLLGEQGSVTVAEIAQRFKISAATARRDAVFLAGAGKAARSHGGLLPARFFRNEPDIRTDAARASSRTARLARRVAGLLPHEGCVFVDAGAICLEVGRQLLARPDLRIFTHAIPLIALAADARAVLTGIGGMARGDSGALTGPLAQAWLAHLSFDAAVIGAEGLDPVKGACAQDPDQAAIRAEVLRRSAVRVLVAEAKAWGAAAPVPVAPWSAFTFLVTSDDLPREARVALGADKVRIHLV